MEPWLRDTDSQAKRVYIDSLRRMTPGDRLEAAFEMSEVIRRLAEEGVHDLYPNATEREVFLRVAARFLDRETMIRVYGWSPEPASR